MSGFITRELLEPHELEANPDARRMDLAIREIRDEITATAMKFHRGGNRNLSMVLTKLDEARLWAEQWLEEAGQLSRRIDRGSLLKDGTIATVATAPNGGGNV